MSEGPLFHPHDIHRVIEQRRAGMLFEYDSLSDDAAVDEAVIKALKEKYLIEVPMLRPVTEMYAEEGKTLFDARRMPNRIFFDSGRSIMEEVPQYTIHIPFDGDPGVFRIAPNAYNSRHVVGEVIGHEVLFRIVVVPENLDVQSAIDREVEQIKWSLAHLRETVPYFDQQLEIGIREAVMARKGRIEARASVKHNLQIPIRPVTPTWAEPRPAREVPKAPQRAEQRRPKSDSNEYENDVFISYASEDKPYIEQLALALGEVGIRVWFDKTALRWGDTLRHNIEMGLKKSRYVIVVFSKAFLGIKKWTELELDAAFSLETSQRRCILPLLHGITYDEFRDYSPALSGRVAMQTDEKQLAYLVNEMLILLDRRPTGAMPIPAAVVAPPSAAPVDSGKKGETVAYTWYWDRNGAIKGNYVRKSLVTEGQFVLEEADGKITEGNVDTIAAAYYRADRQMRNDGLRPSTVMASGEFPQFNLP